VTAGPTHYDPKHRFFPGQHSASRSVPSSVPHRPGALLARGLSLSVLHCQCGVWCASTAEASGRRASRPVWPGARHRRARRSRSAAGPCPRSRGGLQRLGCGAAGIFAEGGAARRLDGGARRPDGLIDQAGGPQRSATARVTGAGCPGRVIAAGGFGRRVLPRSPGPGTGSAAGDRGG
jgi:hypothetical protein